MKRVSKILFRMSTTNIQLLQFKISSHLPTYVQTHTKKKASKISNTAFPILSFYQKKKILKLNGHPLYFENYYALLTKPDALENGIQHKNANY